MQVPVLPETIGDVMSFILFAIAAVLFVTVFILLSYRDTLKVYDGPSDQATEKREYGFGLGLAGGLYGIACVVVALSIETGLLPALVEDGLLAFLVTLGVVAAFGPLMTLSVIWIKECRALLKECRVQYPNASLYQTRGTYLNTRR